MPDLVKKQPTTNSMPGWVIVFPSLYLIILVSLAVLRSILAEHLPHDLVYPFHQMSLSVVWFGALGGVVISLQGIFFHNANWSKDYNYWHAFSGIIGAIYGIISYLFLIVIVKMAVSTQSVSYDTSVFPLAAFTLGYAQKQFNSLIQEVFDVIFRPGNKTSKD